MRRTLLPIGVVVISLIVTALPVRADLDGDTVDGSFTPNGPGGFSHSAVVTAAREFQGDTFVANVDAFADLTANTVTVGFEIQAGEGIRDEDDTGTWLFEDLDWLPTAGVVTGLTLTSASPVVAADFVNTGWLDDPSAWTLTYGDDWIQMSGDSGWQFAADGNDLVFATFDIETRHAVIPVPAAVWLGGLGLGIVPWLRKRLG